MRWILVLIAMLFFAQPGFAAVCCKICETSKPCGNSCISKTKKCSKPKGCACAAVQLQAMATALKSPAPGTMVLSARVVRVVDGDSLWARVAGWPRSVNPVELRLEGVDTPKMPPRAKCESEATMANTARDFAIAKTPAGAGIAIIWTAHHYDSFGRMLVKVAAETTADLGADLLSAGLAREYHGGRRPGWCAP